MRHISQDTQHNVSTTYTADNLRHAVELLLICEDTSSDPAQRRAACVWYTRMFPTFDVAFRQLARRTAQSIQFQRGV